MKLKSSVSSSEKLYAELATSDNASGGARMEVELLKEQLGRADTEKVVLQKIKCAVREESE